MKSVAFFALAVPALAAIRYGNPSIYAVNILREVSASVTQLKAGFGLLSGPQINMQSLDSSCNGLRERVERARTQLSDIEFDTTNEYDIVQAYGEVDDIASNTEGALDLIIGLYDECKTNHVDSDIRQKVQMLQTHMGGFLDTVCQTFPAQSEYHEKVEERVVSVKDKFVEVGSVYQ